MNDRQTPIENDLLTGLSEIAVHLGWGLRKTKHHNEMGDLPTFKLGKGRTVYARRSTLTKFFATQESVCIEKRS
jgi:hypothetical protein